MGTLIFVSWIRLHANETQHPKKVQKVRFDVKSTFQLYKQCQYSRQKVTNPTDT